MQGEGGGGGFAGFDGAGEEVEGEELHFGRRGGFFLAPVRIGWRVCLGWRVGDWGKELEGRVVGAVGWAQWSGRRGMGGDAGWRVAGEDNFWWWGYR